MKNIGRFVTVLLALVIFSLNQYAQQRTNSAPLSPRIANYTIQVSLDVEKKMLSGTETLTWRNPSNDRITELQFHLYYNAFKNSESTLMRELSGDRWSMMGKDDWGWIDVKSMKTSDGEDLTSRIEFIHPDDDNDLDQTVIRIPLKKPVAPGASVTLIIEFVSKIPSVVERTGYYQNYYFISQWFPKIGVYEVPGQRSVKKSGWNCHQYHAMGEFYADFGVYDVSITLPQEYIVGATGALRQVKDLGDGRKRVVHYADDVHDFAWTASPNFLDVKDTWRHVEIRILMQPQRKHQVNRYLTALKATLEYFNKHVGPYPYSTITVVDPAYGAFGTGGMEYPTLITAGSFWGIGTEIKFAELVTEHEFGHQYWYGMVANNEFEEAWLDEGINSYYELRVMTETYGEKTSVIDLPGFHIGSIQISRTGYVRMSNPKIAPIATPSWKFTMGGYGNLVYQKAALMLMTLDRLIGRPVMDTVMKTYFQRWKFRHPDSRDFINVVNEIVPKYCGQRFGKDMNWFFDQVLYGTEVCDYAVRYLKNREIQPRTGVFGNGGEKKTITRNEAEKDHNLVEAKVTVSRLGEVIMPVDILLHFDSGREVRESWDGKNRFKEFKYIGTEKLVWAKVDPDQVLLIDVNTINNSITTESKAAPAWKYALKFMFWFQNFLQLAAIIG
ncbi:MAG: M1 family metallopeptidase [bacterium]